MSSNSTSMEWGPGGRWRAVGLAVLFGVLGLRGVSVAQDAEIEFFSSAFLPQSVTIDAGGTVAFTWVAGLHTLTSGTPTGAPGTLDEPGAIFQATLSSGSPSFSFTFSAFAGTTVHFHDALNPIQIGTIEILGDDLTFTVSVLDNVFEPELLEIFEGDTVRWEHEPMEMLHTVTSGASSDPADNPGALFNEISSDSSPIFEYLFADAGLFPYHCIPHEGLGMLGTIVVQDRFIRGDGNRDGGITIADPISTLDHLFGGVPTLCADAHDANDDGNVDIGDVIYVLSYVFSGGPAPLAPFPDEGPDRTGDALRCGN